MTAPKFEHAAILGLGLIGSSFAKALSAGRLVGSISVFDISPEANRFAADAGWRSGFAHAGQAVEHADIIIFAAPPAAFETLAKDIAPLVKKGAIVTDVASVKRHAVQAIARHLPKHAAFVPGHPIAGAEKTGALAGREDLFRGKITILTPEEADLKSAPVAKVRALWEAVGTKIEYMPADMHDRIYAYVSHLPQIVAFAAGKCLKDSKADESLTRFMRLTHSDAALWSQICVLNADYIREALAAFTTFVGQMTGELSEITEASNGGTHDTAQLFAKIVATCLVATASLLQEEAGVHPAHYAGAGFADMVSPAIDDPHATLAAISEHHRQIAPVLKSLLGTLNEIIEALSEQNTLKLKKLFSQ